MFRDVKLIKNNKKNKGFTLIEVLLVVGFIALAGIGVYVVYDKVQITNEANKEVRNLQVLTAGIKNLYAGSANYKAPNDRLDNILIAAKMVPEDMLATQTTVRPAGTQTIMVNSYGVRMGMYPTDYGNVPTGTHNAFYIGTSISKNICAKLVATAANNFNSIRIGTATSNAGGVVVKDTANNQHSVNVANATNACADNAMSNGNVNIVFITT